MKLPLIFLAFANDQGDYLKTLNLERKEIKDHLHSVIEDRRLVLEHEAATNIDDFFEIFDRYRGRIKIIHYGGHANGAKLALEEKSLKGNSLSQLLKQENEVEGGGIELVFLNGCATKGHVKELLEAGVKRVIATSVPINDQRATRFSIQFYSSLASGADIDEAYARASAKLENDINDEPQFNHIGKTRFLEAFHDSGLDNSELAWALYKKEDIEVEPWKFPPAPPKEPEKISFNEVLIKELIEKTAPYNDFAQKLLVKAQKKQIEDWEGNPEYAQIAKKILTYSFVGILGIQLSHLFAIGSDPQSEEKIQTYIEKCLFIAKRTLELVSFTFISKFWDIQKDKKTTLNDAQKEVLKTFFTENIEADFPQRLYLLQNLWDIFSTNQLELPFPEMKGFKEHLEKDSELHQTLVNLQSLELKRGESTYTLLECLEVEKLLSNLLGHFNFLVTYKMVSIRQIAYKQVRNSNPNFLHRYTALGIDNKAGQNAEKHLYTPETAHTDSVLIYNGNDYQESINLFPFVIDYNTLTFENGSKVCFYQKPDFMAEKPTLEYLFIEDGSQQLIEQEKELDTQSIDNLGELMADIEKFKLYNTNNVVLQFKEAETEIIGASSTNDLENFFE